MDDHDDEFTFPAAVMDAPPLTAAEVGGAEGGSPEARAQAVHHPTTGTEIDLASTDSLLRGFVEAGLVLEDARDFHRFLREMIAAKCDPADTRVTRRVRGESGLEAEVELPRVSFDGTALKDLWEAYPQFRGRFLKIATVTVQMREFNKLPLHTDDEDFQTFQESLRAACRGRDGVCTVRVKEPGQ